MPGDRFDSSADETGQGTVEWIGLVFLVSLLVATIGVSGSSLMPDAGARFGHTVTRKLLCAVSLSTACDRAVRPEGVYDVRLAATVRRYAPELRFGPGLLGLPVDYRTCRSPACADPPGAGLITESTAGEPVTLFTRVLDCRSGGNGTRTGEPAASDSQRPADCSGGRAGRLFITYWAYYPESASLRGVPVLEKKGYHANDWESFQVRVDPDGSIAERASSHNGYNHTRSAANWASDAGWTGLRRAAERIGLRRRGGWGEATGTYLVAGGSHAGNVADRNAATGYPGYTPASRVRLIPLERVRHDPLGRAARFDPITPPWEKSVWLDGEAEGTG